MTLSDKHSLVTGGGSGVGAAIAVNLAACGRKCDDHGPPQSAIKGVKRQDRHHSLLRLRCNLTLRNIDKSCICSHHVRAH